MSDFIKMQKYALLRDLKKQTWEKKMFWEKYFQNMYLIKDFYSNIQLRKQTTIKM